LAGQYIKSAAPHDFVTAVQQIEDRADECPRHLALLGLPRNLAIWTVLTRIIDKIERVIAEKGFGTPAHIAVMLNLSRAGSQVINWIGKFDNELFVPARAMRWEVTLLGAIDQALSVALSYSAFTSTFPLWHKNLLSAELIEPSVVRFKVLGDGNDLRVRAYQQGLRPPGSRPKQGSALPFSPSAEDEVKQKIAHLVQNGSKAEGPLSFSYGKPRRLWQLIYTTQLEALDALFRRNERLDLGGYTIGDFKRFYAGLLAVCAVHENACHLRGLMEQRYPFDSAVLVKKREKWNELLSEITLLQPAKVDLVIRDLSFGETSVMDLYVHPFIPLSKESDLLGIVPHFPLNSRADENIIRVCSHLRPEIHDALSQTKEDEMRDELAASSRPGLWLRGPRLLPEPLPDIDLIIEEVATSSVVIAELKWLRKTIRPTEHSARQEEFLNGITQLKKIGGFLQNNPGFLQDKGDVKQDLRNVLNLHYILIARDYFVWVDPAKGYPVIDYDPFSVVTKAPGPLAEQVRDLLQFTWLPQEGRDFQASYDRQTVNGVSVESQTLYANY
jgi:hypothetical protein